MNRYLLGLDQASGKRFYVPQASFDTHWHLIGSTGKGKTTAIKRLLHELLLDPIDSPCVVVVDRMGGLSFDLLRWISSEFCPPEIMERLVYIEPARDDVVLGFNPLVFASEGEAYYRVSRAAELILKGWSSQNLEEMPRLARWLFNSFYACALLGLTIADSVHLLLPYSEYHRAMLAALPSQLRFEWAELAELAKNRPGEMGRLLESARNRLKPFYDAPALRQMFGATTNRLDIPRFMREGKLVILNLRMGNRIPEQIADAIGGLVINEVLMTARSLPMGVQYPTYLVLDEFQKFVGPDVEAAIPEVRQLGIKLLLGHQSFAQLKQGDFDLTTMIFQAQSRMIFGLDGEDADLLAHELASLNYDPARIKDELYARRQRVTGHRIIELSSSSQADAQAANWNKSFGQNWDRGITTRNGLIDSEQERRGDTEGRGEGASTTRTFTAGRHEQMLPIHEDFWELVNRTYGTFEEDRRVWGRDIRKLKRGEAFVRLVDDPLSHHIRVNQAAPGHLAFDAPTLARDVPEALDAIGGLIEENFRSEWFVSPAKIEAETQARLQRVLRPKIIVNSSAASTHDTHPSTDANPFL